MNGQHGILMNQIWTIARKMMILQKWYLAGSDHPQIFRDQTRTRKNHHIKKMSRIGQKNERARAKSAPRCLASSYLNSPFTYL